MENDNLKFMKQAIEWASDCHPIRENIPKVGAVIAVAGERFAAGRRGTGRDGDDDHAEKAAIGSITEKDKCRLADATLYTTLEPCTAGVRSKPLESCTELIRQHQIKKVFIGILDPNQGVTGKGLWRLQDTGVEVELFPPELSKEIRVQNANFIRSQQLLGVTIISPKSGERLRTYETAGRHTVRLKCDNPPGTSTYLFAYKGGLYWPQAGPFRPAESGVWEIDAHFGSTGDHTLQIVTADDLGVALIEYYRKVTAQNRGRVEKLRGKIDRSLLGDTYPGIQMNGLPKGLRLEDSVTVSIIGYKVELVAASADPKTISRGEWLILTYEIECSEQVPSGIWLGASFNDRLGVLFNDTRGDKAISLNKGRSRHERTFAIPPNAPLGEQMIATGVWRGVAGDSEKSELLATGAPLQVLIR